MRGGETGQRERRRENHDDDHREREYLYTHDIHEARG
jgi:hypothetical protein